MPTIRRSIAQKTRPLALTLAALTATLGLGCNFREYVMDKTVAEQVHYIPDPEHLSGYELTKLTEHVYTFRHTWDRSIVIVTSEGVVVFDPFNAAAAKALKSEIDKIAPGAPIHTLFYSHYHLDHVVGGAVLNAQHVVAHAKCKDYWADLGDEPGIHDIVQPTEYIEGDKKYVIGGVEIDLLYLGHSHTDSLYAFHLPGEKLLFTADIGLVRTFFPMGGPDMYMPGIIQQMNRLAKLDFDTWVPSHFEYGKKADFLESLEFQTTVRRLAVEVAAKYGVPETESKFVEGFHYVYDVLKAKYGNYRGFDQQSIFVVTRAFSGALLGY